MSAVLSALGVIGVVGAGLFLSSLVAYVARSITVHQRPDVLSVDVGDGITIYGRDEHELGRNMQRLSAGRRAINGGAS